VRVGRTLRTRSLPAEGLNRLLHRPGSNRNSPRSLRRHLTAPTGRTKSSSTDRVGRSLTVPPPGHRRRSPAPGSHRT
jgi:hypothetical protein